MSSILSSASSTNTASSIRGYGGLASGLDRDTLIEGMTAGTRAKIAKQKQQKQIFEWKQDSYRSISSKLVEFSRKFMSYTSQETNLSSADFWSRSNVTALGANSSKVSVLGSSSIADSMSIVGIKQLAENATMSSNSYVSDRSLSSGSVEIIDGSGNLKKESVSNLEGQFLTIKYGTKNYGVSLGTGTLSDGFTYDYSNAAKAQESVTRALRNVAIGDGKTLADVIDVTATTTTGNDFKMNFKSTDTAGNTVMINGGSSTALVSLGLMTEGQNFDLLDDSYKTIKDTGFTSEIMDRQDFFTDKNFAERVGGKSITFTYNGKSESIEFMSQAELEAKFAGKTNAQAMQEVVDDMQGKLDYAFGKNRIKAEVSGDKFTFKTINQDGTDDNGAVLSVTGEWNVIGKSGAMKIASGDSNRLNLDTKLIDSGLDGIAGNLASKPADSLDTTYFSGAYKALNAIEALGTKVNDTDDIATLKNLISANNPNMPDKDLSSINEAIDYFDSLGNHNVADLKTAMNTYVGQREIKLKINGQDIKGLSYNSTLNEIISTINNSKAKVSISYMPYSDKFTIRSATDGAGGDVKIEGDDAAMLFTDYTVKPGQDAIFSVKYAGSADAVELTRAGNAFNLDGLNVTLNDTFGYSGAVLDPAAEAITFNAKADADKITKAVTDMIKDFNDIIKLVNDEVNTKPNRKYPPLTEEQKADMKEDQIKQWEEKAKEGMLFNDADIRSLSDSLRFIFDSGSKERSMLESFGISTSSDYGENGKLVINETKFRAALESNPEGLQKLFTEPADESGKNGGVMANLKSITEKYAATTGYIKGILIEKAGSIYAPTSILSNSIKKSMDNIDSYIKRFENTLKMETDRYIKQFTNLEQVISQMNSQSSWLSSLSS